MRRFLVLWHGKKGFECDLIIIRIFALFLFHFYIVKNPHWNFISAMTFNHRRPSHTPTTKTDLSQLRAKLAGWRAKGDKKFQILRLDYFLVVVFIMIVMMLVCLCGEISRKISQSERWCCFRWEGRTDFLNHCVYLFFLFTKFQIIREFINQTNTSEAGEKISKIQ